MSLQDKVAELRSLLVTVLVDPTKTASNNRLVELVEEIAAAVDGADGRVDAAGAIVPVYSAPATPTVQELQTAIQEIIDALAGA